MKFDTEDTGLVFYDVSLSFCLTLCHSVCQYVICHYDCQYVNMSFFAAMSSSRGDVVTQCVCPCVRPCVHPCVPFFSFILLVVYNAYVSNPKELQWCFKKV